MKVALVCMPWHPSTFPSAALGAIASFVRREEPSYAVDAFHESVRVTNRIGFERYRWFTLQPLLGNVLYATLLYPEHRGAAARVWNEWSDRIPAGFDLTDLLAILERHVIDLAHRLAEPYTVVGMTNTYNQLFPNLLLARNLKEINADVQVVFGGIDMRGEIGASLTREYSFIDWIVQGEGEIPFLQLLRELSVGTKGGKDLPGVLTWRQAEVGREDGTCWEAPDLDSLPFPDYDAYCDLAERSKIEWTIGVEGARGCWWDRSIRSGDPRKRCLFCNMNPGTYREKSPARLAKEVAGLSARHSSPRIFFVENSLRRKGVHLLAETLSSYNKEYIAVCTSRADVRPEDLAHFWKAGLRGIYVGLEGLSTSYLERLGKGTTTIQNLQILRYCSELDLQTTVHLMSEFPGSTATEVQETVFNIENFALSYAPCTISPFYLTPFCAVDRLRSDFGVVHVRNHDSFKEVLGEGVWGRLALPWRSWDYERWAIPEDWSPVVDACERWAAFHRKFALAYAEKDVPFPKPLYYIDGGTYLEVVDRRWGHRSALFRDEWRDVYLFCTKIRALRDVVRHFEGEIGVDRIRGILDGCVQTKMMFREKDRYLSLAVATRPDIALARMNETDSFDEEIAEAEAL